ncbi:Scr1 family TA system antitoxin-like transcriptional regulator [Streptomyces sp. KL116D]|uniref:helix-turn-helix domain-containing protein n=1 Tax=Streptomyces sp. KL116D TaxID=3045152 RepID=UPI0035579078
MKMVGRQLKAARQAAGHTQAQLAALVQVDDETIASVEQGRRALQLDLAESLDELLDTKGVLAAGAANMPEADQFPLWAEEYMRQEREAIALSFYANQVLPGLLQTEAYTRAVLQERVPAYDDEEIVTKTAGRVARHEILLRREPPTLSFVLWEPLLRLHVGGAQVRQEQLQHLRATAQLPCISLQIIPLDSPSHAGLDGPFILIETPDHQHLAYNESQRGSQWVADPDEVSRLARKYAMLRTQALATQQSLGLLDRLLGEA